MSQPALSSWVKKEHDLAKSGEESFEPDWSLYRDPEEGETIGVDVQAEGVAAGLFLDPTPRAVEPQPRGVRRYILTSAQDDTEVHRPFLANLEAYATHVGAEIIIAPFTYNKRLFTDHETRHGLFAEEVQPYLQFDRVYLGGVQFCAEMNTLPTANRPLSGLEGYTGRDWGIFPHAKVGLVSIPTLDSGEAKIIATTGAVTQKNYIQKKAGLVAEFHHIIGAAIVEIDEEGRVFLRQLNADSRGCFQDLDVLVADGLVSTGHRVEAITWGDIHREKLDPVVAKAAWGYDLDDDTVDPSGTILDTLRPRYQFFHDLLDFEARNHHRVNDPHHLAAMFVQGRDRVADAIDACARFLKATEREWCRTVVVESNHDTALNRWLKEADYRRDPVNAIYFLECELAVRRAIERGDEDFSVFRWALEQAGGLRGMDFVSETGSFVICQAAGGIECGMHGHFGPNGSRPTPTGFTRMATRMNTGHTHSPGIVDGVYTAGLSGLLRQGYNKGPSSWAQAHIVTYPSGKRSLLIMHGEKWRA